ncbi:helix-turn-helix domain-containing protein [Microbacterium sp. PF5]|uniref:helix-turn-helix domain-containing protein n=1 Tax=Microbacterium sp. PF5 TaxID=2305435 RepID=UPI00109B96D6|nr:helix-turn-helix domain-containing protein [Microbacterium sp. PF5]
MSIIELPEDNRRSKLQRTPKPETFEDVATAMERVEAFWAKYPEGSILPEVESRVIDDGQSLPFQVFTVRAYVRKNSASERPDAVAHATRGENDEDELVRLRPQESAETAAISRAIRNLGILVAPTKTVTPATISAPQSDSEIGADVTAARERSEKSQRDLAAAMTRRGFKWSQATVSQIEKGTRPLRLSEAQHLAELLGFGGVR